MIKTFEDLEVYQLSIDITKIIYNLVNRLPIKERFIISDQMMRASTSIGTNIAEGFGRNSTKEFLKFLYNARGSLLELRHFTNLCKELNYVKENDLSNIKAKSDTLGIKINNLINTLKKRSTNHFQSQ